MTASANQLQSSGLPIFFGVADPARLPLPLPDNRHGQTVRVFARSLSVMQKEAIVTSLHSDKVWRLASDEGPYLDGHDSAPCPLSFMTTGMVAATTNGILSLAGSRGIDIRDLELVQDNRYTMEGSALKGTMTGGALPVDLTVRVDSDASASGLEDLVAAAVDASPLNGLLRKALPSLFALSVNGTEIDAGDVGSIGCAAGPDPAPLFANLAPLPTEGDELISKLKTTDVQHGVEGGAGSSLRSSQSRTLHLRGTCRVREDGIKEIVQELYSPIGSTFRFLSDEPVGAGGGGGAPDAAGYAAAGIAFCFMTQLGRYAKILKKDLSHYNVVQDIHFPADGGDAVMDPVETQVFLDTTDGDDFARRALVMGEQTCFLHALCRTAIATHVTVERA